MGHSPFHPFRDEYHLSVSIGAYVRFALNDVKILIVDLDEIVVDFSNKDPSGIVALSFREASIFPVFVDHSNPTVGVLNVLTTVHADQRLSLSLAKLHSQNSFRVFLVVIDQRNPKGIQPFPILGRIISPEDVIENIGKLSACFVEQSFPSKHFDD